MTFVISMAIAVSAPQVTPCTLALVTRNFPMDPPVAHRERVPASLGYAKPGVAAATICTAQHVMTWETAPSVILRILLVLTRRQSVSPRGVTDHLAVSIANVLVIRVKAVAVATQWAKTSFVSFAQEMEAVVAAQVVSPLWMAYAL